MKAYVKALITQASKLRCVHSVFKGHGVILMLHRVAPFEDKLAPNENMKVTPAFLEQFICQSLESKYVFISVDELYEGLLQNTLPKNFICITLDDGYKDNLTYAAPIFEKYNIPFCIYICTSLPQSTHNMWWFGLEDYLLTHMQIRFENRDFDISTRADKEAMFLRVRNAIIAQSSSYEDGGDIMNAFGITYNPRDYDHLALSWEDIHILSNIMGGGQRRLCTIGAHTHSHPIFNRLTQMQVADDIRTSQHFFKAHLGFVPKHFAYPFGGRIEVDASYFPLIKELGFMSATTTRHGCIYPAHRAHLYALPRVFFGQDFMIESAFKIRRKRVVSD